MGLFCRDFASVHELIVEGDTMKSEFSNHVSSSVMALVSMAASMISRPTSAARCVAGAQQAPTAMSAKQVLGSKVQIEGNVGVGTVDDMVLDDNGRLNT